MDFHMAFTEAVGDCLKSISRICIGKIYHLILAKIFTEYLTENMWTILCRGLSWNDRMYIE